MKLLLDTCTFLWISQGSARLSQECRDLFVDPANQVYLSAASAWEISLKYATGKLGLTSEPDQFLPAMRKLHFIESLPVTEVDAIEAGKLPGFHRDPFDRLLVAQALRGGLVLLTPDPLIRQYPVTSRW